MVVPDKMSTLCSGVGKTETIDDIVQAAFEKNKQVGTGNSLLPVGFFESQPELLLGKAVSVFHLLFFAKLNSVIGWFSAPSLSVLSGGIASAVKSAFIRVAAVSL